MTLLAGLLTHVSIDGLKLLVDEWVRRIMLWNDRFPNRLSRELAYRLLALGDTSSVRALTRTLRLLSSMWATEELALIYVFGLVLVILEVIQIRLKALNLGPESIFLKFHQHLLLNSCFVLLGVLLKLGLLFADFLLELVHVVNEL